MFSKTILIGNLGSEPEMRLATSGKAVTNFNLAVNRSWVGQDGQRQQKTTWFKVTAWGKQAEIISEHVKKGDLIQVTGEVELGKPWTDRDNNQRVDLVLNLQEFTFMPNNRNGGSNGSYSGQSAPAGNSVLQDEDIPF